MSNKASLFLIRVRCATSADSATVALRPSHTLTRLLHLIAHEFNMRTIETRGADIRVIDADGNGAIRLLSNNAGTV